jgi:hypothetical protein
MAASGARHCQDALEKKVIVQHLSQGFSSRANTASSMHSCLTTPCDEAAVAVCEQLIQSQRVSERTANFAAVVSRGVSLQNHLRTSKQHVSWVTKPGQCLHLQC